MRSLREIAFRVRQETWNLWLLTQPPVSSAEIAAPFPQFPNLTNVASTLRKSAFASNVLELAEQVMRHRFPLLAFQIETGPHIDWRRDYINGRTSRLAYFRRVPYLDFNRVGDHKIVWELNRHQHLVLLAQAALLTGRTDFLEEIWSQLESWWAANPFLQGINWTSSLEVAFRAFSWTWVFHLAGEQMPAPVRSRFLSSLYQHGCYIERNLSTYFSPNTHLLGEAVVLHALGILLPGFPRSRQWQQQGAQIVEDQMSHLVRSEGTHFEQSTYYHLYALDMFLFHRMLGEVSAEFDSKLRRMGDYLAAIAGPECSLPLIGDEDGGRFFYPYGCRRGFARATFATLGLLFPGSVSQQPESACAEQAAWWIADRELQPVQNGAPCRSRLFADAGIAVMQSPDLRLIVDAGPFGGGSAGHSHSDTLSIIAICNGEEILVDPGTYTYIADAHWRNWFRGSAAHNSVRVDSTDQALPDGPFRWAKPPQVEIHEWQSTSDHDYLDASCRYVYRDLTHRRRVLMLRNQQLVFIFDELSGESGQHLLEQFWHTGARTVQLGPGVFQLGARAHLIFPVETVAQLSSGGEHGWRSSAYGTKSESPVIRVSRTAALPAQFWSVLDCSSTGAPALVPTPTLVPTNDRCCTYDTAATHLKIQFLERGFRALK
ncbi:MAG: Heparinase family protein [Bryobacterales bacterium]|nr:Heparinase family protein [Bryobacterales bacterium]